MGVVTMAVVVAAATVVVVVGEALSGDALTGEALTGEALTGEALTAEDLSIPTPAIKTEAPPPLLFATKDCPVYEQGELRGIKRHGDKWLNDGSDCEICTCFNGEKRCYYHYCNGLTEGYMTPPSVLGPLIPADQPLPPGLPPLDDEDLLDNNIDDDHEGSGIGMQLPFPDDDYYMHYSSNKVSSKHKLVVPHHVSGYEGKLIKKGTDDDKNPQDNETHDQFVDDFCGVPCRKACPHGYKMDPSTGCRKCKCIKCQSMKHCLLKCPHGLHIDEKGCQTCECRDLKVEDDIILDEEIRFLPDTPYIQEEILIGTDDEPPDEEESAQNPPCNNTSETVSPGPFGEFGQGFSRTTSRVPHHLIPTRPHATDVVLNQASQNRDHNNNHLHHHHQEEEEFIFTHNTPLENDGMIKSAVPGTSPDASQLCVIILPVLVVMVLVCFLIARWWRKSHRDKYDINSYRHEETEKLQAVKTADDNTSVRHV